MCFTRSNPDPRWLNKSFARGQADGESGWAFMPNSYPDPDAYTEGYHVGKTLKVQS
jgi:hypothetical protein